MPSAAKNGSDVAVAQFIRRLHPDYCIRVTRDDEEQVLLSEALTGHEARQRLYQRCTQLGWFETTSNYSVFQRQVPLEAYTAYCGRIFGTNV